MRTQANYPASEYKFAYAADPKMLAIAQIQADQAAKNLKVKSDDVVVAQKKVAAAQAQLQQTTDVIRQSQAQTDVYKVNVGFKQIVARSPEPWAILR